MPNYNSTARMPFKTGGSVKKPKVKRIILWKGKAKDWPGAKEAARQTRNKKADGGKILKRGKTIKGKWTTDDRGNKIINPLYVKQKRLASKKHARKRVQDIRPEQTRSESSSRLGHAKGGKADKKWIQKATKGMRKDKPCTGKKFGSATCPPGSKRYNLAKTFKKMARSKHASGDMVRYI